MNQQFFETIKCYDFEIFHLSYHKKRVARTISSNLNLEEYIYPPSNELLKCKVIYDHNGVIDIEYLPYKKKEIKSFKLIYDNHILYDKKSTDRLEIEKLFLEKQNCDEIIIVKNNLLTDTSIANIALYYDGKWITPKKPLLYGTTRERYLENEILIESDISIEMLFQSSKIALLNAMIDFDTIENYEIRE